MNRITRTFHRFGLWICSASKFSLGYNKTRRIELAKKDAKLAQLIQQFYSADMSLGEFNSLFSPKKASPSSSFKTSPRPISRNSMVIADKKTKKDSPIIINDNKPLSFSIPQNPQPTTFSTTNYFMNFSNKSTTPESQNIATTPFVVGSSSVNGTVKVTTTINGVTKTYESNNNAFLNNNSDLIIDGEEVSVVEQPSQDKTYGDIKAHTTLTLEGVGKVTINGTIGEGAIILKSGVGKLIVNDTVEENVQFITSGVGDIVFKKRPPESVISLIQKSGVGKIKMPGDFSQEAVQDNINHINVSHVSGTHFNKETRVDIATPGNGRVIVKINGVTTTYQGSSGGYNRKQNKLFIDDIEVVENDSRIIKTDNNSAHTVLGKNQ